MTVEECLAAASEVADATIVCTLSSGNGVLQTIATIVSILSGLAVVAAAIFAWWQVRSIKHQLSQDDKNHIKKLLADKDLALSHIDASALNTRLRATLDLLIQLQANTHWEERRALFVKLRDDKAGLEQHANEESEDCSTIRAQLNQYELIAIGIKLRILDDEMYKNYYRGTVVRDYIRARNFIEKERNEGNPNPRYWLNFEEMALRYMDEMKSENGG